MPDLRLNGFPFWDVASPVNFSSGIWKTIPPRSHETVSHSDHPDPPRLPPTPAHISSTCPSTSTVLALEQASTLSAYLGDSNSVAAVCNAFSGLHRRLRLYCVATNHTSTRCLPTPGSEGHDVSREKTRCRHGSSQLSDMEDACLASIIYELI